MSLLIDALRQAEQTRQESAAPTEPTAAPKLRLEPLSAQEAMQAEEMLSTPPASRRSPSPNAQQTQRAAAQQMFSAKQAGPNRFPLILAITALSILVIGSAYLWWATQPRSQIALHPTTDAPAVQQPILPPLPVSQSATSPVADTPPPSAPRKVQGVEPAPAGPPSASVKKAAPTQLATLAEATSPTVRRTTAASAAPSTLNQAYDAYAQGNLAQAYTLYREALRNDPKNTDALTGLGTLSLRAGHQEEATRYFREALVADPKNPLARSQLLSMQADAAPQEAESRLKSMLAEQPDDPSAYFTLGTLYTRQGRWKEAQQSFFQAYTLDGKNPDILYNLAVSLEHLHQNKLASQFYERAAAAAATMTAGFDAQAAARRAQQLATETAGN
ncbi:tetratricopeptide repeat protein [Uliginosibacterium gangwonense]|uniref:tetratricopeptide repeat protein n=1 Tax=Uliginosibacterium gangwonense TaxID=392736 RepID=UPI00036B4D02|nr:tetratricopeptide repeat protein [Uliginosibacterium gangwonense]